MSHDAQPGGGQGILLEAGTNEVEILVLQVGECFYGVNVAKVREVLEVGDVTRMPECHSAVEGAVRIREDVVELVNLLQFLEGETAESRPQPNDRMLVMEFCEQQLAFRVRDVEQIFRASWQDVQPLPAMNDWRAPVTAIITWQGRLIQMLDFESIGAAVGMTRADFAEQRSRLNDDATATIDRLVVSAEDSMMISAMFQDAMTEAGFTNLRSFTNGKDAWEFLCGLAADATAETIRSVVGAIVTDIEMPQMDGLTLTRKIREHPVLKEVPVVVFSSIVSKDNAKKGEQVGANAQIAKAQYAELAQKVRDLFNDA